MAGPSSLDVAAAKAAAAAAANGGASGFTSGAATPSPTYRFPGEKLRRTVVSEGRIPIVLVACGSYSPITFLHLRMFELASDFIKGGSKYELVGMYLSPVSDAYNKAGLATAVHRLRMCELAVDGTQIAVDSWEATQPDYVPTAKVLDHFEHEINSVIGGVQLPNGQRRNVQIALLAGADLLHTMSTPGVWSDKDLDHILGGFGAVIVEREGTDTSEALAGLSKWAENISIIPQTIRNDISSTKVRLFINRDMSIRWLLPDSVREYIEEHRLYIKEKDEKIPADAGPSASSTAS
jgi:nicotinamide mononucleotide adenylyltransferase